MRTWETSKKLFGVACFASENPADPLGNGDGFLDFDTRSEAEAWIERARTGGRFRYFTLWNGTSGQWVVEEEFPEK